MIRRSIDLVVSLLAVFLGAALCSFITIYQPVLRVVYDALASLADFVTHAGSFWSTVGPSVLNDYRHSLLALVAALGLAIVFGIPAGIVVGLRPTSWLSTVIRVMSALGTMTPSFLLAMLLMIFFVLYVLPLTGIRFILLTSRTSDLDPRRLLPIALTLAARPLAHITMVTASTMQEVLSQDYIRTAHSKGLSRRQVLIRHAWPNAVSAILSTLPAMLLFSISSLPIIEFVFNWPGVGQELLFRVVSSPAPNAANAALVSFLLASLGMTYVLVFLLVEAARERLEPDRRQGRPMNPANAARELAPETGVRQSWPGRLWHAARSNPVLVLGLAGLSVVLLAVLAPAQLAPYDPLAKGSVLQMIDGEWRAPPFPPGGQYLLGTDPQARDVLSRLIFGARSTLLLALVVTIVRVTLGATLGWAAAQFPGEIRRNVLLLASMSATLPGLLFAYLVIATIGPHRGFPVFIFGLGLTGWASWTQLIYSGILRIQAQPYMEAAEVIGSTLSSRLRYYLVPNLAPTVIPAVAQELAAALLIVAELGFLGIYLGISRPITLADLLGGQQPQLTIPEWGGMLAGTRLEIFRWYWLTVMPAAAFMLTILSFNLLADGLRRHLERP